MQSPEPFNYEERYGAAKATRWPAIALVVAILGIGWLMWSALYHSNPPLRSQLVSFTITNDREASVRYFIERTDSQQVVVCTLIARDYDKNIVGQIDQEIGAGKSKVELVAVVPTRSESVNADVSSCRAK
ncbi:MAG: DUF4307 domain-containing protein [Candidatus Planktophila sp.]|uniref:DUF4307 domain-containing protein n=1 Tax=freshwater metagenome TaxID=449393 RepID=A0A094S7P1_9ZZZZ|nr:DUF4307 domain-containing protein [Candidatus Planktophila sp.]